jgi:hypothetical protein
MAGHPDNLPGRGISSYLSDMSQTEVPKEWL